MIIWLAQPITTTEEWKWWRTWCSFIYCAISCLFSI